MTLLPTLKERQSRARGDLRMGLPILLTTQDQRFLICAIETLDRERFKEMCTLGVPEIALTAWRAQALKVRVYDGDIARIALSGPFDFNWLKSLADPSSDLNVPIRGPLHSLRGGDAAPHRAGVHLMKYAHLLPAALVVPLTCSTGETGESDMFSELTSVSLEDLDTEQLSLGQVEEVASGRVPMAAAHHGRVRVFRTQNGAEEHYAIEIGNPERGAPVLARLHSACFTGDVIGSLKCDCGAQLNAALEQMGREKAGVLLYLNQEGRGIGLANKMRAYSLQDQGFDTVDANHRLGFEDDERNFHIGAQILQNMGFRAVRLLTNNPHKVAMLERQGIEVRERVPLQVGKTRDNAAYLATKAAKSGHFL